MAQYNLLPGGISIPQPGGQGLIQGIAGPLGDWLEQRPIREARRSLATLGQTDPIAAANQLLAVDDLEGARTLANLGLAQEDRKFRQSQAEADRAWKERNFAADQDYKNRYLGVLGDRASNREVPSGYRATPDGGLTFIPGGPADPNTAGAQAAAREKPPSGYRYSQANPNTLEAIPGGPGEKIDAEVAARLGLTKSFLGQSAGIKEAVKKGELTGLLDGPAGALGFGKPAELRRQIQSGVDALIRNLTGAGMTESEARSYAARYAPGMGDSAETVTSKLDQLERELTTTAEVLGRGRGGGDFVLPQQGVGTPPGTPPAPARRVGDVGIGTLPAEAFQGVQPGPNGAKNQDRAPQGNAAAALQQARAALQAGAPRDAVIQRLIQAGIDPSGL